LGDFLFVRSLLKGYSEVMEVHRDYYTPQEVADILSVDVMRVYHYIMNKTLKTYVVNGEQRINKEEFKKFLDKIKGE